jgi:serine/threonine-protein kinase
VLKPEIQIGTVIKNRYQVQGVLGRGGFGRTYLASNVERCGELCVLKVFVPNDIDQDAIRRARLLFEREARVLYKIDHPQIPKFLAWFEEAGRLFIVQEYINGKTYLRLLKERQKQGQLFSEAEVVQWLKDLLPVLAYLHDNDIVHRDISPDNIMLPKGQSQPVLIDFGLVKQKVSQIWSGNPNHAEEDSGRISFVGKFGYSPPEQIRIGQCFPCSDLYALAVTAIVLLTGKEPIALMDQKSLEWRWHSYVNINVYLRSILTQMLAEKPKDRYQSAQEILFYLQQLTLGTEGSVNTRQTVELSVRNAQSESDENLQPEVEKTSTFASDFIERCHQELTHCIGPIAKYIIEEIIFDSPSLSSEELIAALAAEIPNPQQAAEFRQRLLLSIK